MSYPEVVFGNRRMSAASIAAEVEEVGGQLVSAQTICHTLHQIGLHGCHPRRKPLLKMMHKKASKQFADDKQDLGHGLLEPCPVAWWDQDKLIWFRWCQACVWLQPGEEYKDKCVLLSFRAESVFLKDCTPLAQYTQRARSAPNAPLVIC